MGVRISSWITSAARCREGRAAAVVLFAACLLFAAGLKLPNKPGSLKIAVLGDTGTGERPQYEIAAQAAKMREVFPFEAVLMMGDNMYGGESPADFRAKFEKPYGPLLQAGVKFFAVLGNHDGPNQRFYKNFGMNGRRYYTFRLRNTGFFALDSNDMDQPQLAWLESELRKSKAVWKIAFFHHPLYSSGEKHGSDVQLRNTLEPLFLNYGVNIVLSGHEHFYERVKPQKGIWYFICGSSAKLRKRNIRRSGLTARGLDSQQAFMTMEIDDQQAFFETIGRDGSSVDSGVITRAVLKPGSAGM
jgi:predicted MPP superfamily phosphohydrolase